MVSQNTAASGQVPAVQERSSPRADLQKAGREVTYRVFYPSGQCFELIGTLHHQRVDDYGIVPDVLDLNSVYILLDPRAFIFTEDMKLAWGPQDTDLQWVHVWIKDHQEWMNEKTWNGPTITYGDLKGRILRGEGGSKC